MSADSLSRPGPVLTPEIAQRYLEALKTGMFPDSAAQAIGQSPEVVQAWIELGLSPGAPREYAVFARAAVAVETAGQVPILEEWRAAALRDWKAGAAYLAARYPAHWGPKATRTRSLGDTAPTAADTAADEALVEQLLDSAPPELVRLLERKGWTRNGT